MPTTDTDLESLQEERAFLLRSLADLDAEYEAGDIDDDDYRSLTDGYTARTAAVLRALESLGQPRTGAGARVAGRRAPARTRSASGGTSSGRRASGATAADLPAAVSRRRRRRTITLVAAVVAFGAVSAWLVAQSSGTRQPGQTISGNSQLTTGSTVPGGIDQRLADALKLYDAVLTDDPNQPVALADGGWLEAQAGLAGNRPDLVDTGLVKIEKAEAIDTSFADAHFFRGFLLLRAKNDAPGAVTEFRLYLSTVDPTAPQVASVQALLNEAIKAAGSKVPAGPNAATTTSKP
ncbi:MAG: hypothetical protein QOK39_671 [Acidimicrobiaceae bacterium]|nr:hypothetical protein [Acidimicrobiaceae bacterium]